MTMTLASSAVAVFVALCCISSTRAFYEYNYLTDECSANPDDWIIYLGWDRESTYGVVQLQRAGDYGVGLNCALKLVPPPGYSLNIVVDWTDIYQAAPNTCGPDYLYIYNNQTSYTYCGRESTDRVLSLSDHAVIQFTSGAVSNNYRGFDIYYNLFHTNSCASFEYTCHTTDDRCVLNELRCDGRNNCGDNSDEWSDGCSLAGWAIFLIVLASLAVAAIIIVVAICLCCAGWCAAMCKKDSKDMTSAYPQTYYVA